MTESFRTILHPASGLYREKGSKFIAYALPVHSIEVVKASLENIKKEHPKARHHCYAYRIGIDKNEFRANDDGEPSGTAGNPILGQIDSLKLTNILIVVVRYFGGKLLGTSGLIHAYKTSAKEALDHSTIIVKEITIEIDILFHYKLMGPVMENTKKMGFKMIRQKFDESPSLKVEVPRKDLENRLNHFLAAVLDKPGYEIKGKRKFEGLEIRMGKMGV